MAVTLYVNADHAARDDTRTRAAAADNPALPFATPQAAAMLLLPGDTMQIEPSTLGNANTLDTEDPDVYPALSYHQNGDGSDFWTSGHNAAGDTINVVGHVVAGVRPKIFSYGFYGLENWAFEGIQFGYDRDTSTTLTIGGLRYCTDLTFTNNVYTSGGGNVAGGLGTIHWHQCETYSPYQPGNSHFLNGVGFRVLGYDSSDGTPGEVLFKFTECHFEDIGGEDAIQANLVYAYPVDLEVINCSFKDIVWGPNGIHTDCLQLLEGRHVTVVNNQYTNCSSCFIASDGHNGVIEFIGNVIDETCANGLLGQGVDHWVVMHNTIKATQLPFAIGDRYNSITPGFEQKLTLVNNIYPYLNVAAGVIFSDDSFGEDNLGYLEPGKVWEFGTQLPGLPELGTSARLTDAGITAAFELANSPVDSPGIGEGHSLASIGLSVDQLAYVDNDFFGRPFASPRDVGALQSDDTVVIPSPRPPYVTDKSPNGVVANDVSVTVKLTPVTGQEVDASTVTTGTAWVTDSAGETIPAVVTLGALDDNGRQTVTVDLKSDLDPLTEGELFPLVTYTAHLSTAIEDTNGTGIPATEWSFSVVGPDGPAIYQPGGGIVPPVDDDLTESGFLKPPFTGHTPS